VLSGCASLPPQTGYVLSNQHKMASAHHWQVLAHDIAVQLLSSPFPGHSGKLEFYIEPTPGVFGTAFKRLLADELLNMGHGAVSSSINILPRKTADSFVVKFSTQVVRYRRNRKKQLYPGTYTMLASGIAVMRGWAWNAILPATGLLADMYEASQDPFIPNAEIIICVSVEDDNHYIFLKNNIYYVQSADTSFYQLPVHRKVRDFPLTSEVN